MNTVILKIIVQTTVKFVIIVQKRILELRKSKKNKKKN